MKVNFFLLLFLVSHLLGFSQSARRQLVASMYPYIPNAADFYRKLETEFERINPDVDLVIRLNANYYEEVGGILEEEADIYELDCIFLEDFVAKKKIQPLPINLFLTDKFPVAPALLSTYFNRTKYALPHWVCGNFLFYDKNDSVMDKVATLKDLENAIGENPTIKNGLLVDLKGAASLGEMYSDGLWDLCAYTQKAYSPSVFCTVEKMDMEVVKNIGRLPKLTYSNWGRVEEYHLEGEFYARQFAKGNGRAFVGYSEALYNVITAANKPCKAEENCLNPANIGINTFILADKANIPIGWTDAFGLDAQLSGQKLSDAENFLTFCISDAIYKMALIPESGEAPRYLLPAYKECYSDPEILKKAPLYSDFFPIVERMMPISARRIAFSLQMIGEKIDKEYLRD